MVKMIQVLGEPASGKTTVMRALIDALGKCDGELRHNLGPDGRHFNYVRGKRFPDARVIVMGIYDGSITDGTDRFGLNTQPAMLGFLEILARDPQYDDWTVVLEGDRFANVAFAEAARALCPVTHLVLTVEPSVLEHRHLVRGDKQNAVWLRGRATKNNKLVEHTLATVLPNQTFVHMLRNTHILLHLVSQCQCATPPEGLPLTNTTSSGYVPGRA